MKTNGNASLPPWGELEGGCPPSPRHPLAAGHFPAFFTKLKKEEKERFFPLHPFYKERVERKKNK